MEKDKIGIIGDMHLRPSMGYADYLIDRREGEKKEILDFIVTQLGDCDTIVMLGDQLNGRNNLSSVIREFVAFIERFSGKQIYILAGNHEIKSDGSTAIDFLKEINNPNWHIITEITEGKIYDKRVVFCPYRLRSQLGADDDEIAAKNLMNSLNEGDILFIHHAISNTETTAGIQTNIFNEPVLPQKKLEEKFKLIFGGHIHKPQKKNSTIIAGSIFNNDMGESNKKIWKITSALKCKDIALPGRPLIIDKNKTVEEISKNKYPSKAIVKMVIDDLAIKDKVVDIKKYLRTHVDAYILLEQYPHKRKRVHFDDGAMLEFKIEDLLSIYAKQKKINEKQLLLAWNLIKN